MTVYVASFDIGKCNFAFCVERFDTDKFKHITSIPKAQRYTKEHTCTEAFEKLLGRVYTEGEIVLHRNVDITGGCTSSKSLDDSILVNMYKVLDSHSEQFVKCSIVIIEQQMSFGSNKINTVALKLAQHCRSYFIFKYQGKKEIIEFPAYHKTQVMGAGKVNGKAMSKPERKKWSVEKMVDIFLERGDIASIDEISNEKKKDDLADVFVQLQAFKFLRYVSKDL